MQCFVDLPCLVRVLYIVIIVSTALLLSYENRLPYSVAFDVCL